MRQILPTIAAGVLIVSAGMAQAANAPPAMIVPGQFNVSATGAATYSIPIVVPPGTAGMVPALSLDYSSQSGDGIEGIGWTLSGLPSISRCPRTIAQDSGVHGSVNYDTNDKLCMEGQRLIYVSGGSGYGTDGAIYHTEIESFSKIEEHNGINASNAWFEVWTKAGQHMQFGNSTDSQILTVGLSTNVIRAWAVNYISDTVGNYLTVSYNCTAVSGACTDTNRTTYGEAYPIEINYTGNAPASVSPYNSVQFSYGSRTDSAPMYQAGATTQTTVLLTDIKTYQASNLVSDYQLAYRAGTSTTHSRLTSVTLCDSSDTNCLAPTTFGWQGGTASLSSSSVSNYGQQAGISAAPGDWNGDGLTDELVYNSLTCPPYNIWLGPNQTTSGGTLTNGASSADLCIVDQASTILAPNGTASFALTINGITTSPFSSMWYYTLFTSNGPINLGTYAPSSGVNLSPVPGDYNGDGVPDFLSEGSPTSYIYYGSPSSSSTFTPDGGHALDDGPNFLVSADFDGDGCTDIWEYPKPGGVGTTNLLDYSYACNPAVASVSAGLLPSTSGYEVTLGDFNGDGKTDILLTSPSGTGQLYLSTGTGFTPSSFMVPSGWGNYAIYVGDWNGDGKADILLVSQTSGTNSEVWLSTGNGFAPALDASSNPIVVPNTTGTLDAIVADWNNDGATDFIMQDGGDTLWEFAYAPELMTTVNNGIGSTTNISYSALNNNGAFYQKCPTGGPQYLCGSYPTQYIDGALYVVGRVDASNGLGTCNPAISYTNCYSSTYGYAEAQTDLTGRGFLGFSQVVITDLQTSVVQTTNYCTLFPLTGLVSSQTKVHSATTLSSVGNSYNSVSGCGATGTGGAVNTVELTGSTVASNDLNGAAFPTTTTSYTYDSYGNALTVNVAVSDGSSKDTTNTYNNDTTNWFLGRLLTTSVNSIVGSSNLTRQSSFAYDAGTGLLTQESIEPGVSTCNSGSSSCEVDTSYTYDTFGHRITTTVSGTGITTRTSYAFYDSQGEFQTSAANALGQYEYWAYDTRFGGPTTHTGPNFLTTTWSYDTFGRMTLETRPDGTETAQSYAYCAGSCPTFGQFSAQSEILAPGGGSQAGPISTNYYDMLSRSIANDTQGFNGSNIRVATSYDGNGRILETSRPYFAATSSPAWTSFTYDALGRVTQATFPDTSYSTYGFNGLTTTVTNSLSQTTMTMKNAQGLAASVEDASSHTTSYIYDAFGNSLTITDPAGNVVANTYDIRGNKIISVDPDMGRWTYAYDVLSELISQNDNKNQATNLTYDVLGRLSERSEVGLDSTWTFGTSTTHHNVGQLIEAKACTASGCATKISDRTISYDSVGRPSDSVLQTPTDYFGYTTAYNTSNGHIASVTYPSGLEVDRVYNAFGYLTNLAGVDGEPIWAANTRDAELHLTSQTAGNGVLTTQSFDPNTGLVQSQQAGPSGSVASFNYGFDTIGNLTSRTDNNYGYTEWFCYDGLNRLVNYNIGASCTGYKTAAYDDIGNITSKSDTGTYSYPGSGSVLPHAVSSISGTVDGLVNPQYSYDANGNLTCVSSAAGCSGTIGRVVNPTSFNMAGSIIQGTTSLTLTYDDQHQRLSQVSTVSGTATTTTVYLNDPASGAMSERVSSATTTPTDWNGFNWDAAPWGGTTPFAQPTWVDYITVDGQIVAQHTVQYSSSSSWGLQNWGAFDWGAPAGNRWGAFNWGAANWSGPVESWGYFVLDHLGSVAVVTDQGGNVIQRLSYDAWGKQRNPNGSDVSCGTITAPTTRGFTNQEEMPTQCLANLNARLYDPSIGKFMAADPLVGSPYTPNAFNRYAYVLNNPLSLEDPSGDDPETVIVTAPLYSNPITAPIAFAIDVISTVFDFFGLFGGGGHAAVAASAPAAAPPPPAPQIPSPSVSQVPSYSSGTPSGLVPVTNTLTSNNIETVVVNGQAAANSGAVATQAGAYAGVGATSVEQIVVTATRPPPPSITGWIPNLLSPFVSPVMQLFANSPSNTNGGNGNHPQYDGVCRMADGSLHPYNDAGGGYANVYSGNANTSASGAGIGEAANSTAMPTLAKPGGISGGGASGPVTSPASSAARDLTGNARLGALRPFTGTGSIGGSIGRAIPVLGTGLMLFDFMQLSSAPVCTPVSNPGTLY